MAEKEQPAAPSRRHEDGPHDISHYLRLRLGLFLGAGVVLAQLGLRTVDPHAHRGATALNVIGLALVQVA